MKKLEDTVREYYNEINSLTTTQEMDIKIGDDLIYIEDEYKSKIVTDILKSKQGTIIIVYKFWNQFGNIERCSTLNKLLQTHKIKQKEKI